MLTIISLTSRLLIIVASSFPELDVSFTEICKSSFVVAADDLTSNTSKLVFYSHGCHNEQATKSKTLHDRTLLTGETRL